MADVLNRETPSIRDTNFARPLDGGAARSKSHVAFVASMLILLAALWVATRPYYGIVHDSRFYMLEALHQLNPGRFARDLYFQFGSQDQFTIFAKLYLPLLPILGMGGTSMALTILGQLLWVCGALCFAHTVIRPRSVAWLALAGAIVLPSTYTLFFYGESFVTPRLYAEALTMIALTLLLRRRAFWALGVLIVSAALHPLTTLPGFAFAFLYLACEQPLWWAAALAAAALAAVLSFMGIQPFSNLGATYDSQWFDVVKVRDSMCLVTRWSFDAYFRVAGSTALGALAWVLAGARERRLLAITLIVGLGGIAVTLLGGDLARSVFIIEVQPWRGMWILTLMANLYVVPSFFRLRRCADVPQIVKDAFLAGIALLLVSNFALTLLVPAVPLIVVAVAMALWQVATHGRSRAVARAVCLGTMALAAVLTMIFVALSFTSGELALESESLRLGIYSFVIVILGIVTITKAVRDVGSRRGWNRCLPWVSAALLLAAAFGWDAESPWNKFVESSAPAPHSLASFVPANATVYWESGTELLWFKLQRPNYFSCEQGTGAVFFRDTALAYRARAETLWPLRTADFGSSYLCPNLNSAAKPHRTRADLQAVCARDPELDDLVLTRPVEGADAKIWDSPVPYEDHSIVEGKRTLFQTSRFYIYSCAGFR
jgi:hypothetical protein